MKKNISINISGIIFHIEEDGYEKLKNYLDSINSYFSSFEDSGEIISDIESRIAEIFLTKLNEGKQVITADDVDDLVSTMGSIRDFQAVEQEEGSEIIDETSEDSEKKEEKEESTQKEESFQSTTGTRRLYRDTKRKLVGGVASGIANYFKIDPLWIRLLFVILALDIFVTQSLSAVVILAYIILWIVLPGNDNLEEPKNVKKLYRNPDDKVLGGVAGGIAAYFGTDPTIIRLIFVLSIFLGGTGLVVYFILWIIVPEAKSITEKVQMKGEPVTLANIETNIKKSFQVKSDDEENTIVKILLFPFRLIAMLIEWLSKALGPILSFLVDVVRVFAGVLLVLIGISTMVSLLIAMAVILGITTSDLNFIGFEFPYEIFSEALPVSGIIASFFATFIPALAILLLGLMVVTKSRVVKAPVGWTLLALWIVSIGVLSFIVPKVVYDFRTEGEYQETITWNYDYNTLNIDLREVYMDGYDATELEIKGYNGDQIKLVKEFTAYGNSRRAATDNAQMVEYNVDLADSVLTFDSSIQFEEDDVFRFQSLDMTLYIPYGQEFVMDKDLRDILRYYSISRYGYYFSQLEDNRWVFNPSGLECLTCYEEEEVSERRQRDLRESYEEVFNIRGYYEEFELNDFDRIKMDGAFEINIVQSRDYRVVVNGPKDVVKATSIIQDGDEVSFEFDTDLIDYRGRREKTRVIISVPSLTYIELNGASTGFVKGFDEDECEIRITGASEADIDMDVDRIDVVLSGASKLNLSGTGRQLFADLSAASALNAYDFRVEEAEIEAAVASSARVYVTEDLEIRASMASDIKYRGGASVRRR